jgi:(S)-2-hydroxyglutarate dehydrogenase
MTTIGVIGGGIVGVAIARALALRPGLSITLLEKEGRLAAHQTGHNSGVVHAGLYYTPGSLKAELCTRGRELTRDFCAAHHLPYREIGKLVVATRPDELPALDRIEQRSVANQVPGLRRLGPAEMAEIEPHVSGLAALHSPRTAVVDFSAVTEVLAQELRMHGGTILFSHTVTGLRRHNGAVEVQTPQQTLRFDLVVVCAGLHSDVLARQAGADPSPKILPFRGEYRVLAPGREHLVRGMIYPVPDPKFPFLGVHFTRSVYDDIHVGPNAVPALAREGYRWRDVSVRDTMQSLRWPGASTLARRHWRMGMKEIAGSFVKPLYFREAQRFIPELKFSDLGAKSAAGVRAQAWAGSGELLDDFAVDQVDSITLLRNAPSPAATSAMAIADHVIEKYLLG